MTIHRNLRTSNNANEVAHTERMRDKLNFGEIPKSEGNVKYPVNKQQANIFCIVGEKNNKTGWKMDKTKDTIIFYQTECS